MRALALGLALAIAACATPTPSQAPALNPADLGVFFDCVRTEKVTLAAAHRGGFAKGLPENALETLQNTTRQIPALLEIDVQRTKDGVLVLMHDATLERTSTGAGAVKDQTLAALKALRLKDNDGAVTPYAIPRLDTVLNWARGRAIVQLDVKRGVPFDEVVAAVRTARAERNALIITYNATDAGEVARLAPDIVQSVSIAKEDDFTALIAAGVRADRMIAFTGTRAPNPALNAFLTAQGVETIFGTLGPPETSWDGRFARAGNDGGYVEIAGAGLQVIATDRPSAAFATLDSADGPGIAVAKCLTAKGKSS
jgi:glycerophosphoryl diester phosphodiesterase